MRWWLALAFALIAAITALAVAEVFSQRTEAAFRSRAEDLAVGKSVGAAAEITQSLRGGRLPPTVRQVAGRHGLALFVFDAEGRLLTAEQSHGVELGAVQQREEALTEALEGRRSITSFDDGRATLVALPLPTIDGAVLAYAERPDLAAGLGIARDKIVEAALWAVLVGAVAGLLVAALITARLRRIAAAAATIEGGSFERPLRPRFRDELGALAATIDRMRVRLRDSFARLESERDRLTRLLERLQDGVVTIDRRLQVEFANAAARRLTGASLDEGDPLPEPWQDVSLRRLVRPLFAPGAAVSEARVTAGEERTYAIVGIPAGGEAETAVLVLTDISERERRERAEREFVTNAAHELRTPLTAITGSVEMLEAGAKENPPERDRFLGHIARESARLGRLARALLTLAEAQTRLEPLRLAPVELRPLLEEVAESLRPRDSVEIIVDCPPELSALTEHDLAEQVVANLAANAVKHTVTGHVSLAAFPLADGSIALEVRDTGTGMRTGEQERIFDRFYRAGARDADGFGLGLAIVRDAARALGGTLAVRSEPGRGTTVRVVLPGVEEKVA
jgi:signal transduction histidine kinase/HAMP domain-containing protein